MAFKDRVERLLEKVVGDLGCSGQDLVDAIQDNLQHESALSTEKRFCIQTLLTFDDFDAFYSRISEYAAEKQAVGYDTTASGNAEVSEWALQEAIARSILEAHARGQLDETEASWLPWAEAFVQMSQAAAPAESGVATEEEFDQAKDSPDEAKAETKDTAEDGEDEKDDGRMQELEKTLIRERFKVDLLVAQRIADSNAQMKKQMLNLVAEAVDRDELGDDLSTPEQAAEEELAGLFTHIETIGERLKDVKSRCFKFESVTQQQMDTIYLFLKEKVHYKQDLVAQERDISAFIFTQIHEKDEALIPLMLEWLLLESEQLRTQNQIQEHLAGPRDEGYWTQVWDEASQAFYYVNSVSKESVWEPLLLVTMTLTKSSKFLVLRAKLEPLLYQQQMRGVLLAMNLPKKFHTLRRVRLPSQKRGKKRHHKTYQVKLKYIVRNRAQKTKSRRWIKRHLSWTLLLSSKLVRTLLKW
ncbi:uncharacterized protein IUM83_17118 [Phytophthora cinnamomi]|uniref:uncharacterized protein n=1 Tax=Phytophthora cinnamomi TaxID=4785 RepID=UPI00355A4EA2|nr:hypothetical protein IUM83_17118 [Phytophthora cinnamomi]